MKTATRRSIIAASVGIAASKAVCAPTARMRGQDGRWIPVKHHIRRWVPDEEILKWKKTYDAAERHMRNCEKWIQDENASEYCWVQKPGFLKPGEPFDSIQMTLEQMRAVLGLVLRS